MQGHITRYDKQYQRGYIASGQDTYVFSLKDWTEDFPPYSGCLVEFDYQDKILSNVSLFGEYKGPVGEPVKSKMVAGILGLLLGWAGVHRFYLGFYKIGLIQLAVTIATVGIGAFWGMIEGVLILSGRMEMDAQRHPLK
jgi:TM2 domain